MVKNVQLSLVQARQQTVLRLVRAAASLNSDELATAVGYLVGHSDSETGSLLLRAVSDSVRARIEQQDVLQAQIRDRLCGYENVLYDLASLYRDYPDVAGKTLFNNYIQGAIRNLMHQGGTAYVKYAESVEVKNVNYLLTGSFRPMNKLNGNADFLQMVADVFRSLHYYNFQGYGGSMTVEELIDSNLQWKPNEDEKKGLSLILKRAKEIVGLEPFPENIE